MFKNKTEQNRNDEKYNQTGITVKIHSNHDGVWANMIMLKSIAARSSWRSPVIAVKQAQKLHRPPFEWKNKSLLWYPFRCVEWKVTSVTAAEFCRAVIPRDLHVPMNSAVIHSKNTRLEQFVIYLVMWKNSRVFMNHNYCYYCIRDLKTSGKSVELDLPKHFSL